MKSFGKRGQGAMEYLMTYGWAILVVMIVGVAMWQMGLFNIGGGTATTASGFPRIKPLLATAKYDADSDALNVTFVNGAGGTLSGITVTIDCQGTEETCTAPADGIRNGDTFDLVCDNTGADITKGDPYICDLTIDYTVTVAGKDVTRTDFGSVRGPSD